MAREDDTLCYAKLIGDGFEKNITKLPLVLGRYDVCGGRQLLRGIRGAVLVSLIIAYFAPLLCACAER